MIGKKQLISIAVDGPVGAGKSTLCDALAEKLDILHLDTGAMYRAIGLYAIENKLPLDDEAVFEQAIGKRDIAVSVDYRDGAQLTYLNGRDVSQELRGEQGGAAASAVSRFPAVRKYLVAQQQQLAKERSLLIDGRDIGTVVLKDAKVKMFLTASPEERAMRRYRQLINAGKTADYQTVLEDLKARDYQDANRATDPLRPAEDAIIVDTSGQSFEESLEEMLEIVKKAYDQS